MVHGANTVNAILKFNTKHSGKNKVEVKMASVSFTLSVLLSAFNLTNLTAAHRGSQKSFSLETPDVADR